MKQLFLLVVILLSVVVIIAPTGEVKAERVIVDGAFQSFERGYMIWQGGTGTVWVLSNSGLVLSFPESVYGGLPDNPIADTSPDGLVYPVSGFGRVWGNFRSARNLLGWGLEEEYAYSLTVETSNNGTVRQLDFPDGRDIRIIGNRWSFVRNTPLPVSDIPHWNRIPTTFQTFEGGYMMWWSDTGSIWVLYNTGESEYFSSQRYGGLSENPVWASAPSGRFKPIQGFGKVWGHFPHVRNRLGWGLEQVHAYIMDFQRYTSIGSSPNGYVYFRISFPDNRLVYLSDHKTWRFVN